jgi:hypothetical protein
MYFLKHPISRGVVVVVIVWKLDLQLPLQSVSTIIPPPRNSWNIIESDDKHHNSNPSPDFLP